MNKVNMNQITTIQVYKKTRDRLDKYQKSKKIRTRDDVINFLLDEAIIKLKD